ncbi:hypothetical protein N7461_008133 [Penicillium sp. DV-2018c]|nr:hypothetical protein N7461_008133 [Penicillium sp. DV-2018c]
MQIPSTPPELALLLSSLAPPLQPPRPETQVPTVSTSSQQMHPIGGTELSSAPAPKSHLQTARTKAQEVPLLEANKHEHEPCYTLCSWL